MQKKQIIGIIGEQAGGKGAAADIIRKHYGGHRLTVSNMLRRTLESLHLEPTRENLIDIALVLKKGFGDPVLMEAMVKEVEMTDSDLVIVDGFRMPGDSGPFRREYGDSFILIYVTADQKIRYERSVKRGEKAGEDEATLKDFQSNEAKATEASISEVGERADFKIENNAGKEELEKAIIKVLSNI